MRYGGVLNTRASVTMEVVVYHLSACWVCAPPYKLSKPFTVLWRSHDINIIKSLAILD